MKGEEEGSKMWPDRLPHSTHFTKLLLRPVHGWQPHLCLFPPPTLFLILLFSLRSGEPS